MKTNLILPILVFCAPGFVDAAERNRRVADEAKKETADDAFVKNHLQDYGITTLEQLHTRIRELAEELKEDSGNDAARSSLERCVGVLIVHEATKIDCIYF